MRTITRNVLLGVLAVLVLLLALGALPSLLRAGDPYYLTATQAQERWNASGGVETAVNVSAYPERRYPYTHAAVGNATAESPGLSHPYWRGPVGFKGAFTHSPFDELEALSTQTPNATDGDAVFARHEGVVYRLTVEQEGGT